MSDQVSIGQYPIVAEEAHVEEERRPSNDMDIDSDPNEGMLNLAMEILNLEDDDDGDDEPLPLHEFHAPNDDFLVVNADEGDIIQQRCDHRPGPVVHCYSCYSDTSDDEDEDRDIFSDTDDEYSSDDHYNSYNSSSDEDDDDDDVFFVVERGDDVVFLFDDPNQNFAAVLPPEGRQQPLHGLPCYPRCYSCEFCNALDDL
ncbi:hypothetical protein QR680_000136 [Steinernema hermaphroditum]|uniref:Uncharacterized protein n=1 Tax=Steinernema hermaphroditum TaxID=289476 RepID=A0AA39GTQ5_9BILA|nr:hypothetical protein QR680_000136 [Steinernema hermaphroditum]